ncbi:MAG: hypothetical protein RR459_04170, partial [Christensenellaceae bacterium]
TIINQKDGSVNSKTATLQDSHTYKEYADALDEIKEAAKIGGVINDDVKNLVRTQKAVAKYEKELAIYEQKQDFKTQQERNAYIQKWRELLNKSTAEQKKAIAVARANARGNERLEKAINKYKTMIETARIKQTESKERTRLLNLAKRAAQIAKKSSPATKAEIEALIGELDLTSKGLQYGTKLNLQKLAREYEKMKESPNFIPNPDIEKKITRLDRKQIANMQIEDVRELIDVLRGIMHEIRNANKEIGVERAKNISDIVNKGIKETRASKGVGNNRLFTVFNTDSLTPMRKFAQLGGWHAGSVMESIGQQLNDGQHKQMEFTMKSSMHFENFVKNNEKAFDSWSGKNAIWVDSGVSKNGVMIKITPEMRISMYLHSLNADNMRHIDGGGVRIPSKVECKMQRTGDALTRA